MKFRDWNLQQWIAGALGIVIVLVGIVFAVAVLRNRGGEGRSRVEASPRPTSSREAYQQVTETRKILVVQFVQALEAASERDDRPMVSELSKDLVAQGDHAVEEIVRTVKENRAWNLRIALLDVLQAVRTQRAVEGLSEAYRSLKDTEVALKIEIIRRLGRMGGGITRNALANLLADETSEKVRPEISKALVAMGMTPDEAEGLAEKDRALLAEDVAEKQALRKRLATIREADLKKTPDFAELRKIALEEKTIAVALEAFRKLQKREDGEAAAVLAERAKAPAETNQDKIIQTNALAALVRMRAADARIAVKEIALEGPPELRVQIIELLGSLADQAMLPLLDQIAKKDQSEPVSNALARARVAISARTAAESGEKK